MKHDKIKKLLVLYIDGNLNHSESENIKKHLTECPECRLELQFLEKTWNIGTSMAAAPPDQWFKIINKINYVKERRFIPGYITLAARSLAYVIVVFGVVFLGNLIGNSKGSQEISLNKQEKFSSLISKELYLDRLDAIPPEFVENITFSLQDNSGEKK